MSAHDPTTPESNPTDPDRSANDPTGPETAAPVAKPLSPAAQRALAEAAARRADIDRKTTERPQEFNGRGGLEPARYGDWEVNGIASDF
ncbi:MAG: DUF1674 domain-containing protein [Xanthobacteraceae bacterium]